MTNLIKLIKQANQRQPRDMFKITKFDPNANMQEVEEIQAEIDAIDANADTKEKFEAFYKIFLKHLRDENVEIENEKYELLPKLDQIVKERMEWGLPYQVGYHEFFIVAKEEVINKAMIEYFAYTKIKNYEENEQIIDDCVGGELHKRIGDKEVNACYSMLCYLIELKYMYFAVKENIEIKTCDSPFE